MFQLNELQRLVKVLPSERSTLGSELFLLVKCSAYVRLC